MDSLLMPNLLHRPLRRVRPYGRSRLAASRALRRARRASAVSSAAPPLDLAEAGRALLLVVVTLAGVLL
jgi:hypothetical protein